MSTGTLLDTLVVLTIDGAISTASSTSFVLPQRARILGVTSHVGTAPAGADLIYDIHDDGTTIYTVQANRPKITDAATTATATTFGATDLPVIEAGSVLEIDVDQVGSGTAGSDLSITIQLQGA
jgi:hypothetical protein